MTTNLRDQCRQEGFRRHFTDLVKQALSPKLPTHFASLAGREAEMATRGFLLDRTLRQKDLGPITRFLKEWQVPYGMRSHLSNAEKTYFDEAKHIRQMRASKLTAGDTTGAKALSDALDVRKHEHRRTMADLYAQMGTASEPRRKVIEIGLPIAAGGAAVGGVAGGVSYLQGRATERDNTESALAGSKFMDRLKYLVAPKQTASRWFNS